jgi:iron complex outermembrane receptor protein
MRANKYSNMLALAAGTNVGQILVAAPSRGNLTWWPAAVCSVALLAVGAADTAMADVEDVSAQPTLEETLVTARRREERLIDTPIAVTAISSLEISRRNLKDLADIARLVPNMAFDLGTGSTGSASNAQIFIRGIGQQDFLFTSDPGVGLYVDGVYFARGTGVVMDMVDLERIEVLRGPQGTLFGKNTVGGAINITSRKPNPDSRSFMAQATVGDRDRFDVQAAVNLPLVKDTLSLRVSGSSRNQDGYVDRIEVGDELGDTDSLYGRAQLRWTPSDTLSLDFSADVTRKRESSAPEELVDVRPEDPGNILLGVWNVLVAPRLGPGIQMDRRYLSDEYESQATGPNFSDFDMCGVSLTVNKDFDDELSFKSITAYRDQDSQFAGDTDHSPLVYTETNNDNAHDQFSQEFQLSGLSMDGRLDWVVGAFYMKEEGSDTFDTFLGSGLYDALEAFPLPLLPLTPDAICPPPPGTFQPCAGGSNNPVNIGLDLDVLIYDDIEIESYALFGEANYAFSDRLTMTAGLRYSDDEKTFTTSLYRKNAGVVTVPPTKVSDSWDDLVPRLGLKYELRKDAMIYASATGGYKSGGFNGRATSLAEIGSFDPEEVWSYEAGTKVVWPDRQLGINAAVFFNDYTDMSRRTRVRWKPGDLKWNCLPRPFPA